MVVNKRIKTSDINKKQQIYDCLLYCIKTKPFIEVLEKFNHLFIKARY